MSQASYKDGGVSSDTLLMALQRISLAQLDEPTKKLLPNLLESLKLGRVKASLYKPSVRNIGI